MLKVIEGGTGSGSDHRVRKGVLPCPGENDLKPGLDTGAGRAVGRIRSKGGLLGTTSLGETSN